MIRESEKIRAIDTIVTCAKKYDAELKNNNLLILSKIGKMILPFSITFEESNFLHLTGMETNSMSAVDFLRASVNRKLSLGDFSYKSKYFTRLKLEVLQMAMEVHKKATSIGEFEADSGFRLYSDIIAGTEKFGMGFVRSQSDEKYYPNTVLGDDARSYMLKERKFPIVAILRKRVSEERYNEITYISKNINRSKLYIDETILDKLDSALRGIITDKSVAEPPLESPTKDAPTQKDASVSRIFGDNGKLAQKCEEAMHNNANRPPKPPKSKENEIE